MTDDGSSAHSDDRSADPVGGEDAGDVVRGDRFAGGPARSFLSSMVGGDPAPDARLFAADLAVDRAHVVMLAEQGIVAAGDAAAICDALAAVEDAGFDALPDAEDVHAAIETEVVERVGDAGRRMHTARSRNDEVAACIRHRLRGDLLAAAEATLDLRAALVDVAAAEVETVLPGYTHRQPAQPTTVAHWALSYASGASRDTARLLDAHDRTNRSPLGAAAFAGTPFPIDRGRTAELLGFDGLVTNATDAVSTRDFGIEALSACAGLGTTLSGLCTDGIEYASDGLVVLNDAYASTSSIMPQKKNPDTLELARARAGDATGALDALLATTKGLPRAYNRDLQRATPHLWRGVDAVTDAAAVVAGAIATARWDADACRRAADEGFATATGVADALAAGGVPFRTAHAIVARAAEQAESGAGDRLAAVEAAVEDETGGSIDDHGVREAVERALDPAANVAARDSVGGPAPETVETAIMDCRDAIDADRSRLADRRDALGDAAERLDAAVAALDGGDPP